MRQIAPFFWLFAVTFSQTSIDLLHMKKIVRHTYLSQYDSAKITLRAYAPLASRTDIVPTYTHLIRQMQIKEFEDQSEERSDSLLAAMETTLDRFSDEDDAPPFEHYLRGTLLFIKAAEESRQSNNFTALQDGYDAVEAFEAAKNADSRFLDVNLGIAVFKYWKSVHTENIPFFSDEKEEAFELLKSAKDSPLSSDLAHAHQLVYILENEGKTDSAYALAKSMAAANPHAPMFEWAYAYMLAKKKRFLDAYNQYNELYQHYFGKSVYNEMELQRKMSECLHKLGDFDKALSHIAVAKLVRTDKQDKLEGKLQQILDLEEKIRHELEHKK